MGRQRRANNSQNVTHMPTLCFAHRTSQHVLLSVCSSWLQFAGNKRSMRSSPMAGKGPTASLSQTFKQNKAKGRTVRSVGKDKAVPAQQRSAQVESASQEAPGAACSATCLQQQLCAALCRASVRQR